WTTRLGTAYCRPFPFSFIVVALGAMYNSSHLITTPTDRQVVPETRKDCLEGVGLNTDNPNQ
ncbi:MAG: hypothetical protein LAP86_30485, partial [Acidobacteriia bacterium]|nr:hypothetical protein [Terriglobia bacterium]